MTAVSVSMRSAQSTLRSPDTIQRHQRDADVVMAEADLHERDPRQHHRDEQQHRGDELGDARAGGGRLGRMVVVVAVVVAVRRGRAA